MLKTTKNVHILSLLFRNLTKKAKVTKSKNPIFVFIFSVYICINKYVEKCFSNDDDDDRKINNSIQ